VSEKSIIGSAYQTGSGVAVGSHGIATVHPSRNQFAVLIKRGKWLWDPLQRSMDTFHCANWTPIGIGIPWPLLLLLSGCLPALWYTSSVVSIWVWSSYVMCCLVWSVTVCCCVCDYVLLCLCIFSENWRQRQTLHQQKMPDRPCQWNFLEASHFSFDLFSKIFVVFLILMLGVMVVSWSHNCYAGFLDLITENYYARWRVVWRHTLGFFSVHRKINSIYRRFKSCSITKSRYIKAKLHSKTSGYNLVLIGFKTRCSPLKPLKTVQQISLTGIVQQM